MSLRLDYGDPGLLVLAAQVYVLPIWKSWLKPYPESMGLIDRAFGADKNTLLFQRISLHWRMVESNYSNFIKNNSLNPTVEEALRKMVVLSKKIASLSQESIKGFGVVSPDIEAFIETLDQIEITFLKVADLTDKQNWVPEAILATRQILAGNKKFYQQRQLWFSN